jgi:Flp pilus assembly protein TadG
MTRRLRRLIRDVSGANLVEAAIATPLVLLLTFSIADFSTLFFVYLALEHGVSEATRVGVTGGTAGNREAALKAAMRAATPALTIPDNAFSFSHLSPGGSGWVSGAGGPDDIDKVTVQYSWQLMTPLLRPLFPGGAINIRVESSRKNEWRFE